MQHANTVLVELRKSKTANHNPTDKYISGIFNCFSKVNKDGMEQCLYMKENINSKWCNIVHPLLSLIRSY